MYVTILENSVFPSCSPLLREKGYIEIRAVATWKENSTKCQTFLDSEKDLDRVPQECDISIVFEDGTYVELPMQAFMHIFKIIPKGKLTEAIYGE